MAYSLTHDPKLLPQEEATYAEPILMPAVNKPINLTASSTSNAGSTSPKATLRKVVNNHGHPALTNNMTLFETSAPPTPCPPPGNATPAALYSYGESFARDPYSSFRSRDPYGGVGGSIRSHASSFAAHGPPGQPTAGQSGPPLPPTAAEAAFGTLRSNKTNMSMADGYGTTRSVKKVYL